MYYQKNKLRFECTGCGACCCGVRDAYVRLSRERAEQIREHLDLSPSWFQRRYLCRLEGGGLGLQLDRTGSCPFLIDGSKCRVYPVRPAQCQTYPFWPEIVSTRQAWRQEGFRCEGIGRGPFVAKARIEQALRHCQEEDKSG